MIWKLPQREKEKKTIMSKKLTTEEFKKVKVNSEWFKIYDCGNVEYVYKNAH